MAEADGVAGVLLVANKRGDRLSRIDLTSGRQTDRVPTCGNPHELAVSPEDEYVALACYNGSTLEIYHTTTLELLDRIELGDRARPHGVVWHHDGAIALTPDSETLWVGANSRETVYMLDPETVEVQGKIATGAVPIRLAADPAGEWVVSSNFADGSLTVIDAQSGMAARTIDVSGKEDAAQVTLIFSDDRERLYAAETGANRIAEVDFASGRVLRRLQTGEGGDGLAVLD